MCQESMCAMPLHGHPACQPQGASDAISERQCCGAATQGERLTWPQRDGRPVPPDNLPREVLAAGDARVHAQALQALDWGRPESGFR